MAKTDDDDGDALIDRTNALLKKHRPKPKFAGSPTPVLDIPVLTEVVNAGQARPAASPAATDTEQLALRLHEEVLRGLQPQINALLDARLAQTLGDLLEQVLRGLEAELKVAVRAMVRDAVAAAIDREVLRLAQAPATPAAPTTAARPVPPGTR
jgi:hypothetical protein